jgi:hypothetical protein
MTRAKKALYCLAEDGRNAKNAGNWLEQAFPPGDGQRRDIVSKGERNRPQPHEKRARNKTGDKDDTHPSRLPAQPWQADQPDDGIAQGDRSQWPGGFDRELDRDDVETPGEIYEQDERKMGGFHAVLPVSRA